ncbi:MAG: hemerythrin domain-containing protein [Candidatus Sulfotelmatobacter sp.]
MLRHKSLIPLSHQHQHALALCVRIDRASPSSPAELELWQAEIEQHFEHEIKVHFFAEETIVFPYAREFPELTPIVEGLLADHAALRESFSQAQVRRLSAHALLTFARQLSAHIRKEERQLFEELQRLMTPVQLADLQAKLEAALKGSAQICSLGRNRHTAKQ